MMKKIMKKTMQKLFVKVRFSCCKRRDHSVRDTVVCAVAFRVRAYYFAEQLFNALCNLFLLPSLLSLRRSSALSNLVMLVVDVMMVPPFISVMSVVDITVVPLSGALSLSSLDFFLISLSE